MRYICSMPKPPKTQWILLFAIIAAWILAIQLVPRLLPFDFVRVNIFNISVHTDYFVHVLLFILIVLVVNVLRIKIQLRVLLPLMLVVGIAAEVIQLYIPNRTFNYWDLGSNVLGVIIGVCIVWVVRQVVFHRLRR